MDARGWVEIIIAASVPISIIGLIWNRITTKKGIGVRAIQFMAVVIGMPMIAVLAFEKVIEGAVVGTLLGGVFGYLLSNIGNFDKTQSD